MIDTENKCNCAFTTYLVHDCRCQKGMASMHQYYLHRSLYCTSQADTLHMMPHRSVRDCHCTFLEDTSVMSWSHSTLPQDIQCTHPCRTQAEMILRGTQYIHYFQHCPGTFLVCTRSIARSPPDQQMYHWSTHSTTFVRSATERCPRHRIGSWFGLQQ